MTPLAQFLTAARNRAAVAPNLPLFEWNEDTLRIAYLNGGLARATYDLQSRYVGPNHQEVGARLIEDAIRTAVRTDSIRLLELVDELVAILEEHCLLDEYQPFLDRIAGETGER